MPTGPAEIETIVRVVLQRLREIQAPSSPPPPRAPAFTPPTGTLRLEDRLITLERLEGRLEGIQVVQVPRRAVVTPAVMDELRSDQIRLERVDSVSRRSSSGQTADGRESRLLVVADASKRHGVEAPVEFVTASGNCSAEVCRIAAHLNSGGVGALWCAATPFAALRATIGNPTLQAVQLERLDDLTRALREAGPNVFILDDRQWPAKALSDLTLAWLGELA